MSKDTKDTIIALLRSTDRPGIEGMIAWLEKEGFFTSPASTKFHGCYAGGLAEHCLRVCQLLNTFQIEFHLEVATQPGQQPLPCASSNIIIAALLHDVCKVGAYLGDSAPYKWNRNQPPGHARLSIERIREHISLLRIEELMIKFHMGVYGLNEYEERSGEYPLRGDESKSKEERYGGSLANAWYHNPITKLMYFCDELATFEQKEKAGTP